MKNRGGDMIIWRGWGILVLPIAFAAFLIGTLSSGAFLFLGLTETWAMRLGMLVGAILAALAIWFAAKGLQRPPRVLVDPNTGQQVRIAADAGSLFFIPTKYWAFIVLILGIAVAAIGDDKTKSSDEATLDEVTATSTAASQ